MGREYTPGESRGLPPCLPFHSLFFVLYHTPPHLPIREAEWRGVLLHFRGPNLTSDNGDSIGENNTIILGKFSLILYLTDR